MVLVMAIAGLPGAGKTTLVRALVKQLTHATVFHYDDYSALLVANRSANPRMFMATAACQSLNASLWDDDQVVTDLTALRAGSRIRNTLTGNITEPAPLIIVDCLFGRAHPGFDPLIDTSVVLDTPAEVALARRFLQICRSRRARADPVDMRVQFITVLQAYLTGGIRTSHSQIRQKALREQQKPWGNCQVRLMDRSTRPSSWANQHAVDCATCSPSGIRPCPATMVSLYPSLL
jgi:uridine kinase